MYNIESIICGIYRDTYLEAFIMFEQFKELLIDEFQVDESKITLDAELSGDLAINSIELAELILRCEEEFGIDIQEEEMHKFVTVGDVVEYLNTLEK
jgi:acyl carrier protein